MLRRLGIRSKVLAVLAVPMLVVLLAGVFISFEAIRDLRDARTARQVVDLVATYVPLNAALDDERVASLTGAGPEDLSAARGQTDTALADFQEKAGSIDLSRYSATLQPRLDELLRQMSTDLPQIRANVDNAQLRVVGTAYTTFVATQIDLIDTAAHELTNRDLATYLVAYAAVARTADGLAEEYIAGREMLARTQDSSAAGQSFATLASQTELLRGTARTTVDDLAIADLALPTHDPSAAFTQIRNVLSTGNVVQMSAVSPTTYAAAFSEQNQSFREVADGALAQAATQANGAIVTAWQRTLVTIAVVVLAAAASLVLAIVVSRAIVIPLRRLTAAATDVREELPRLVDQVQVPGEGPQMALPQIPVTTRDEVGRLAAAFNAVNATTLQVAQEQAALRGSIAEMFVNVARRDQVLLNRQLSFIDSLERTEEDPQSLANLFRLDHLATRMRRNAESLLVLAGIDSGRRLRDALPLSDVVRTASSEIEQYDRIQLDLQADPHMLGFNALPAAHLLAELLENATVFSEPETPVVVTTAVAGPYVEVRILDEGLGMTEAELVAANEKIGSTSAGDALGAQRLGLYVVGRLAQRLSAEVVLRKSRHTTTGTETVVRFPATLFQPTEASPLGAYGGAVGGSADALVFDEVDLSALTDGTTAQGLPRRRSGESASGLPTRVPARGRANDDGIVLPPVATPDSIPADLSEASDWSPVVQSEHAPGLPSRTPAADAPSTAAPVPVADPAARAGKFAGFFRGRGEAAAAQQAGPDDAATGQPSHAAQAAEAPFVVPGLMPEDEADTWVAPEPFETRTTAPLTWSPDGSAPTVAGWPTTDAVTPAEPPLAFEPAAVDEDLLPAEFVVPAEPVPPEPALPETFLPAETFLPTEAFQPAANAGFEAEQAPVWSVPEPAGPSATETPAWAVASVDEAGVPAASGAAPVASAVAPPSAPAWPSWAATPSWTGAPPATDLGPATYQPEQQAVAPTIEPWAAPATDTGQWPVVAEPAPSDGDDSASFANLPDLPAFAGSGPDDDQAYAPFERSLDEARAWATGSFPPVTDAILTEPAAVGQPVEPVEPVEPDEPVEDVAAERGFLDSPVEAERDVLDAPVADLPAPAETEAAPMPPAADVAPEVLAWTAWPGSVPDLEPELPAWETVDQGTTTLLPPIGGEEPSAEPPAVPDAPAVPAFAAATPAPAEPAGPPVVDAPLPTPAWGAIATEASTGTFSELVRNEPTEPKRRRGLFARRAKEPKPENLAPAAPAPAEPSAPVRSSAWAPAASAPALPTPPSIFAVPPATPPAPVALPAVPAAPVAPEPSSAGTPAPTAGPGFGTWSPQPSWSTPVSSAPPDAPSAGWSPPEWAPRPGVATSDEAEPVDGSAAVSQTRIGTLDDGVAAMLALRSDIQEQALSELSQLSTYRPQVVPGSERLTRRVPAAVPEAAPDPSTDASTGRDPEEIRSRLSSFQSGTVRGRRAADLEPEETS